MQKFKKITVLLLVLMLVITSCVFTANAATLNNGESAQTGATAPIIVHYKSESVQPYVYYWNSLPTNITVEYPGKIMTKDTTQGDNWYTYTFSDVTKVNMLFTDAQGNQLSKELTRNTGEWWYKNNRWYSKNPETADTYTGSDMREDSIYFVITTRFYDGDTGNNVHCWDDGQAGNPDSDPAWRGDFKGLIDKLDYIKALGFSAIWITPVVTNASGYDYHGYHAMDMKTVDIRYESDGATYQDLIDAAHEKDMKIVQDVVIQHSGNFGEATLAPLFTKVYNKIQDLSSISTSMIPTSYLLDTFGLKSAAEYYAQKPAVQYQQRLDLMKQLSTKSQNSATSPTGDIGNTDKVSHDAVYNPNNYYHNGYWQSLNWDDWTCKYCQIAGDCVDYNTENPDLANFVVDAYGTYLDMGVDSFRVDTVRHVSRLSLNLMFNQQLHDRATGAGNNNFYMFGEVCCRYNQVWYRDHASESAQFYTWAESDSKWASAWNWTNTPDNVSENIDLTLKHWSEYDNTSKQPTSTNAFLDGNNYHTPDYSQNSGMGVIDFSMHWNFDTASGAFNIAKQGDKYYNDSTWNVVYVESHDYAPDRSQKTRFTGGTDTWAENLSLMFTFRGIPCLYYGGEVEFGKGNVIDVGPNAPLSTTGRAYFGDYLEGTVTATDFSEYTASGKVADTLNAPLAKHLQRLNQIRRAIPALQKGQYSVTNVTGDLAFKRRYTDASSGVDSFVCVAVTNAASFTNIPNGTYIDAVTGDKKIVTDGTLSIAASGKGNMRAYVLSSNGFTGIDGKIGSAGTYLK